MLITTIMRERVLLRIHPNMRTHVHIGRTHQVLQQYVHTVVNVQNVILGRGLVARNVPFMRVVLMGMSRTGIRGNVSNFLEKEGDQTYRARMFVSENSSSRSGTG